LNYLSEGTVSVILPMMILIWTLLIKIIVNHNSSSDGIMEEILRLPGDISILTTSFSTTGILIVYSSDNNQALMNFIVLLVGSFIITLLMFRVCKKMVNLNDKGATKDWKEWIFAVFLFFSTYIISGAMLYFAVLFILMEVK